MIALCQAASGKEVLDLAKADDFFTAVFQHVEQGRYQRRKREITSMFGTCKISWCPDKWTGYDASNGMFSCKHSTCNLAHLIQLWKRNNFLVCRELKNAVRGGIQDGTGCTKMFFTKFLDDFRARCWLIADYFAPDGLLKLLDKVGGESMGIGGKGFMKYHSHHLPMACGAVFASCRLCHASVGSPSMFGWRSALNGCDIADADLSKVGQFQA